MSKAMFKVYYRDKSSGQARWTLQAAFLWKYDARVFLTSRGENYLQDWKVMHKNRNIKV